MAATGPGRELWDSHENYCGRPDDQKMNGKNNRSLKGFLSARDRNWGPDRASPLLKVTTLTSGTQGTTALHRLLSQSWIQSLWTLLFCNRK